MTEINYSSYSIDELYEAKSSINKEKYPENFQALLKELKNREPEILVKQNNYEIKNAQIKGKDLQKAIKKVFVLGVIQVFAALCLAYLGGQLILSGQADVLFSIVIICIVSFNAICGYTLLTKQKKWYWLSLVNQGLQIPNIALNKIVFSYTALGTVFVGFNFPNVNFGISALFNPGFQFLYLENPINSGFVGVDVLAIIFFFAILMVLSEDIDANNKEI